MAGDQRHRSLGERAHDLAHVHVERVQVGGQRADLVDDRRDDHLHRLGEREAADADQVVDRPVEVLGVRAAGGHVDAQHPRLLSQLLDRVDLAVVPEDRERLHAPERGPGVGGVAVVTEAADGLEALVEQVGVVLPEHAGGAHHLVDAGGRRERRQVEAELLLQLDHQLVEAAIAPLRRREQAAHLPEVGLLLTGGGAERLRLDRAEPLGEDPEAGPAQQLAGVVARLLDVLGALHEHVGDREGVVARERRVVAAGADLLGPDLARDVDQDPAAVPLAVDVAGAVEHLLEVGERQGHRLAAGRGVLSHRGVDRARVEVFHRGRRNPRPPRKMRRVEACGGLAGPPRAGDGRALQLNLPGSAPSSSGRATGTRGRALYGCERRV